MKFFSSVYNVGYPVYGAKFLNDTMLLVAGGGGEGNNGIPNKLTVLRIDFDKKKVVKRFREITLDPNDDSPTTLDVAKDTILMGCNENSERIKNGEGNQHLRKFLYENEHLRFVASIDFDGSKTPEDYTKLIYLSKDGTVGAIASSKLPTIIRIIDPKDLTEKYEIETGHDVKDMHFAPDGKVISYITATTLEVISIVTGRFIVRKTDFDKNLVLSKMRFLTDNTIVIAASLKKGTGVVMIKISLKSGTATVLKSKIITNKFKGVTSMDVDSKNQLAVLASNDNSIVLVKLNDLSVGKLLKNVHNFAITRVTFSPDSQLVASVSAANTVHIIRIPQNFALSTPIWKKMWTFFTNFVFIVLIGIIGHYFYKYDLHSKTFGFLKEQYIARRNRNSTINDIFKQTTLVGDVISTPMTDSSSPTIDGSSVETSGFVYTSNSEPASVTTTGELWSSLESLSTSFSSFSVETVNSTPPAVQSSTADEGLSMADEIEAKTSFSSETSFTDTNHQLSTDSTSIFQSSSQEVVTSEKPTSVSSVSIEVVSTPQAVSKNTYSDAQNPEKVTEADAGSKHFSVSSSKQVKDIGSTFSASEDNSFARTETSPCIKESSSNSQIPTSLQDPPSNEKDSMSSEYSHTTEVTTSNVEETIASTTSLTAGATERSSELASPVIEELASTVNAVHTPLEESVPIPTQSAPGTSSETSLMVEEIAKSTPISSDINQTQKSISTSERVSQTMSQTSLSANPADASNFSSESAPSEVIEPVSSSSNEVLTATSLPSVSVSVSASSGLCITHSEMNQKPSIDYIATDPLHGDSSKLSEPKESKNLGSACTAPASMSTSTDKIRSKAPELEEPVPEEFAPPEPKTPNTKEHSEGDHTGEAYSLSPDPKSLPLESISSMTVPSIPEDFLESSTEDVVKPGASANLGATPENENKPNLLAQVEEITITKMMDSPASSLQVVTPIDGKIQSDVVAPEETPSPKLAEETPADALHDEL